MPDLERIQQNTPGTLSQQWYEDGTAVDAGTVTIGITRADGTELVAPLTGTAGSGTAARTYNLTTTHTALLDRLAVTWTSSLKGTLVSYVEVVGGFVFTISELKAVRLGSGTDTLGNRGFTSAQFNEVRTAVEEAIEAEYGTALVPRYARETVNSNGGSERYLRSLWPNIRAVREATLDGATVTTDVEIDGLLGLYYPSGWGWGRSSVTVGYEHGLDRPPERVKRGALLLAKRWLVEGPVDDRTTSMSNDDGTFTLATPGRGGSIFGLPELDAAIMSSPYRVGVA